MLFIYPHNSNVSLSQQLALITVTQTDRCWLRFEHVVEACFFFFSRTFFYDLRLYYLSHTPPHPHSSLTASSHLKVAKPLTWQGALSSETIGSVQTLCFLKSRSAFLAGAASTRPHASQAKQMDRFSEWGDKERRSWAENHTALMRSEVCFKFMLWFVSQCFRPVFFFRVFSF